MKKKINKKISKKQIHPALVKISLKNDVHIFIVTEDNATKALKFMKSLAPNQLL